MAKADVVPPWAVHGKDFVSLEINGVRLLGNDFHTGRTDPHFIMMRDVANGQWQPGITSNGFVISIPLDRAEQLMHSGGMILMLMVCVVAAIAKLAMRDGFHQVPVT